MSDQPERSITSIKYRSGLSLSIKQISSIQEKLDDAVRMIPAKYALLVDTSGQLVTTSGEKGMIDPGILGSLIAADLAASQEIARLTGEFQDYQMILREGERTHIIISEAGKTLAFLVLFSKETPIGWARRIIQKAARGISEAAQQNIPMDADDKSEPELKGDLPNLFNDALDQIWKE